MITTAPASIPCREFLGSAAALALGAGLTAREMTSSLGNMFDNTIALTRIIMSGLLDRHPRLKLVCPHLGGTLPYIIGRLDHQTQVLKRGPKYLTRAPSEYLKMTVDNASPVVHIHT